MRIVIIEDEKISANNLIEIIKEVRPDCTILALLTSVTKAVKFLKKEIEFDIIFSDIELGDGISFQIFKQVNIKVPVIFCTAFDKYALEAFNANGIDYILKPFAAEKVNAAIEKYENFTNIHKKNYSELLNCVSKKNSQETNQSILIHQNDKIIPLNKANIAIMYLNQGSVKLFTFDNKSYHSQQSLEDFEKKNDSNFFRANRQFIINRKAIKEVALHFNRKLLINLSIKFKEQIFISKEKAPNFLIWLAKN